MTGDCRGYGRRTYLTSDGLKTYGMRSSCGHRAACSLQIRCFPTTPVASKQYVMMTLSCKLRDPPPRPTLDFRFLCPCASPNLSPYPLGLPALARHIFLSPLSSLAVRCRHNPNFPF